MQQLNAPSVRWEWISEAWNLFTKQWSVWVLMILVMYLIVIVAYLAIYIPVIGMVMATATAAPDISAPVGLPIFYVVMMFVTLAISAITAWLYGGLYNAAFRQLRGEQISVGNLFSGGKYLTRILGLVAPFIIAYFVSALINPFLPFLFFIAGLIALAPALFILPMIVEGGKGTIDAVKASIEVAKRDWLMFSLFFIVLGFIAGAGSIACGIGVLATAPLLFLGQALAYRDCVGMSGAQMQGQFMPPPGPPDYRSYELSQPPPQERQAQPWSAPSYTAPPPPPQPQPQPAQPESKTATCPNCGATLARVMNFCNQCGRPLRNG